MSAIPPPPKDAAEALAQVEHALEQVRAGYIGEPEHMELIAHMVLVVVPELAQAVNRCAELVERFQQFAPLVSAAMEDAEMVEAERDALLAELGERA